VSTHHRGRSFADDHASDAGTSEFSLLLFKALQTADAFAVATPADWRPGDPVIVPTADSCGAAADRMAGAEGRIECKDWFFCTKQVSEADVENAIRAK